MYFEVHVYNVSTVSISLKEKEEKIDREGNGMAFDLCLTINSLVIQ